MKNRVWLSWSSGKDSAFALSVLRKDPTVEVVGLLTTVNQTHERVAMHAVRRVLLQAQAQTIGLPLLEVPIPYPCSNEDYDSAMSRALALARADGVTHIAFGDLFLEDIRQYRESRLAGTGIAALFPLWQRPTGELARAMLAAGIVAHLTAVDPSRISPQFVGRRWDEVLLAELPSSCDPCGENGEFHTFVSNGPGFSSPLEVTMGGKLERDGFWFADVVPGA